MRLFCKFFLILFSLLLQNVGARNVFDAVIVNLENKPNEQETHSSSSGFGISTNPLKATAVTASANTRECGSKDTFLNDAFIRGAMDFHAFEGTEPGLFGNGYRQPWSVSYLFPLKKYTNPTISP
jgi:hypothetical protein